MQLFNFRNFQFIINLLNLNGLSTVVRKVLQPNKKLTTKRVRSANLKFLQLPIVSANLEH